MDKIFEIGTLKIFSQLAQNALFVFGVDPSRLNFGTTSISVYVDYDLQNPPFQITYGHSKDKRLDLKQFLISMQCVDRNIPILGGTQDGDASDKTLNNGKIGDIDFSIISQPYVRKKRKKLGSVPPLPVKHYVTCLLHGGIIFLD